MSNEKRACEQTRYEVTTADLPLSCPLPTMRLWDAHPKVYLPIERTGFATCSYCGAEYVLTDFDSKNRAPEGLPMGASAD